VLIIGERMVEVYESMNAGSQLLFTLGSMAYLCVIAIAMPLLVKEEIETKNIEEGKASEYILDWLEITNSESPPEDTTA
jgi:hypothetical protein